MTDLTTLIAKLEAATGPDRELDAEIWLETSPGATRNLIEVKSGTGQWPPYTIDETRDASGLLIVVPSFTASIDAAVALAERVLPGWSISIGKSVHYGYWLGRTSEVVNGDIISFEAEHSTPSIALVIAILLAKKAEGKV